MILGLHFWEEPAATVAEEIAAHKAILAEQERFIRWADAKKKEKLRQEIAWRRNEIEELKKQVNQ